MRAMLRRLTRAAWISVHAPDGSHSYVAIFFILVLPNTCLSLLDGHLSDTSLLCPPNRVKLSGLYLHQVDYRRINAFWEHLEEQGLARNTIASIAGVLRAAFNDAVRKR